MAWMKPRDFLSGDIRVSQITVFLGYINITVTNINTLLNQEIKQQLSDISMAFLSPCCLSHFCSQVIGKHGNYDWNYRNSITIMYLFPQNDVTGNLPVWSEYILQSNSLCKLHSLAYTTFSCSFVSIDTSLMISVATSSFVERRPDLILRLCPFHISSDSWKYFAMAVASSPGQDA